MTTAPVSQDYQLEIGENFSGQVAIGDNNFQVGSIYGGVINHFSGAIRRLARPTPVLLRPRAVSFFLDRQREYETAVRVLEQGDTIQLAGEPGIGKTWLLRRLGNELTDFADGIIYLRANNAPLEDILQLIFDSFYHYEGHVPIKPNAVIMRQALHDKEAIFLIDDINLPREEIEELVGTMEFSSFLLISDERTFWGEGRAITLKGLPTVDSLALLAEKLGRAITDAEASLCRQICGSLNGHPLRIFQAAAMMVDDNLSLADYWQMLRAERSVVETLTPSEEATLSQLAAVDAPLTAVHLQELTGIADIPQTLDGLARKGWLEALDTHYYQLAPEQLVVMHLAQLGGGPVTIGRLSARVQRRDTAVLLQNLVDRSQVKQVGPSDGRQQYQLAQDGWFIHLQSEAGQEQAHLTLEEQILVQMAQLDGGPLTPAQINPTARLSDIRSTLETLCQKGLVERVTQYRLLGSGALLIGQFSDLDAWRQKAIDYFRQRTQALRGQPYRLAADIEPVQSLLDAAMAAGRWAEAITLVQGIESALSLNKAWDAWANMLNEALTAAALSGDDSARAWALHQLGSRDRLLGNNWEALKTLIKAYRLRRQLGETEAAKVTYHNLRPLLAWSRGEEDGRPMPNGAPAGVFDLTLAALVIATGIVAALLVFLIAGGGITPTQPPGPVSTTAVTQIAVVPSSTTTPSITPSITPTPSPTVTPSQTPTITPTPCFPSPPGSWVLTTIQAGDTLSRLAVKHNASVAQIQQVNCLVDSAIRAGEQLWLPYVPPTATFTPTPTPTPFLAIGNIQQTGPLVFSPSSIGVPLAVQVNNQGGSEASLSTMGIAFDAGNGQPMPANTANGPISGMVPAGSGTVVAFTALIDPAHAGKVVTIHVTGDSESAVPVHLLLPRPNVRIVYNGGNPQPILSYDPHAEYWQSNVSLSGIVENAALFQGLSWEWTIEGGPTYHESTMSHVFTAAEPCIPFAITLTVRGTYNSFATSGTAVISSQCQ